MIAPETSPSLDRFADNGFAVVPAERRDVLDELRRAIFDHAKTLVPYRGEPIDDFLNGFHRYELKSAELNAFRLSLVDFMSTKLDVAQSILDAFGASIRAMVGPDIATQKVVNIVVQQPGDADQVPIHRDAPSNSHFELIVWLPLVDCYGTKSMFAMKREDTAAGLAMLQGGETFKDFSGHALERGIDLSVRYGEAFFFSAGLYHGCKVNVEPETRWSLNMRYKNLFSPYGPKGLAEFFRVLELSPLTKVGFAFEDQEFGR
ncbi:MAG TPA: sporadic carbohydrate cluster 2OG-Fe(II) oxygenase [Candidatus Acidoferrales bacterium]|nr:sporadic carbohydrate cluster 2OG-Fe(II) oxygenase [Candidatus Acidoferrales bacterium]